MFKIITDSCGELFPYMKEDEHFAVVPLTLDVDGYSIIDDETFDQEDFLRRVSESPNVPKSACPSPAGFMESFGGAERVYVVTLSSQLSGSYNSAVVAGELYREEKPEAQVHVFDSKSASIGQSLIADKIFECENRGLSFDEVVAEVDRYIETQHTYFVLESLDTLRKAGRLSGLKSIIATTLNIKPIMGSTPIGSIQKLDQVRGMKKALVRMVECMIADLVEGTDRILAISHCNCPDTAALLKSFVEARVSFRDIVVVDTRGVSSLYAGDGGVIMVV